MPKLHMPLTPFTFLYLPTVMNKSHKKFNSSEIDPYISGVFFGSTHSLFLMNCLSI